MIYNRDQVMNDFANLLGGLTKIASDDQADHTSKLVSKLAETANALDEAGEQEAASAVDDALQVILKNLAPKQAANFDDFGFDERQEELDQEELDDLERYYYDRFQKDLSPKRKRQEIPDMEYHLGLTPEQKKREIEDIERAERAAQEEKDWEDDTDKEEQLGDDQSAFSNMRQEGKEWKLNARIGQLEQQVQMLLVRLQELEGKLGVRWP